MAIKSAISLLIDETIDTVYTTHQMILWFAHTTAASQIWSSRLWSHKSDISHNFGFILIYFFLEKWRGFWFFALITKSIFKKAIIISHLKFDKRLYSHMTLKIIYSMAGRFFFVKLDKMIHNTSTNSIWIDVRWKSFHAFLNNWFVEWVRLIRMGVWMHTTEIEWGRQTIVKTETQQIAIQNSIIWGMPIKMQNVMFQ